MPLIFLEELPHHVHDASGLGDVELLHRGREGRWAPLPHMTGAWLIGHRSIVHGDAGDGHEKVPEDALGDPHPMTITTPLPTQTTAPVLTRERSRRVLPDAPTTSRT